MPSLGILLLARRIGAAVLTWLSHRSFWQLVCMALALACLVQFVAIRSEKRHSAKVETRLVKCSDDRRADRQAYAKAQRDALAKNLADIARIKQQQDRINDETVANLNARLERLRRELSKGGTAAPQGHPDKPGVSQGGPASGGAAGQAGVCLASEELLRAAESEERHDRLIDWVIQQSKVDPSKP